MRCLLNIFLIVLVSQCWLQAQDQPWLCYGNDPGGTRFVSLSQIDATNVDRLHQAWSFRTDELLTYQSDNYLLERSAFEATPLMVAGRLYFPTPSNRVFALDATTGKQLWIFDPKLALTQLDLSEMTCRGVSYWTDGAAERLLMGTIDGRLCSINASNGKVDRDFGNQGFVDLKLGTGLVQMTSAPVIYRNIVIAGTSIGDNNRTHAARGTVRAFHVLTGTHVWSFDPVPASVNDPAMEQWQNGSAFRTGAANVWAPMSVDTSLGLVFLPTSSPSPDFYGGERPGNNDYANSVVALDALTGEYQWHFQVVHHDLWDYDIPCQPVLFDLDRNGTTFPAVAVGTKMGHIFILDRRSGKPLFPYEERAVPSSDVPGEVASATQPFPILPKPLGLQSISREDIWGPTEIERARAQAHFDTLRYQGIFTPPSLEGSLLSPGNIGGIHWGGMSYDPSRRLLITNINRFAYQVRLHQREPYQDFSSYVEKERSDDNLINPETNRMMGTPYRMSRSPFVKVSSTGQVWGLTSPPWGTILGIDMVTGELAWEQPLGYMGDADADPKIKSYGSINKGGTIVTESGLTFIAATMDNHLRAFDTSSGKLLWEGRLPASGIATPMSYMLRGKQYIVIAAGGHGKNPLTTLGDYVIAFALPD